MRWAILVLALTGACAQAPPPEAPPWAAYQNPQRVVIEGYDGDAMEPFLSRDGEFLFFNNSNEPGEQTDLHWAARIDDLTFRYRGPAQGVNSAALDGVATMSADGRLCFISPRSYEETMSTVFCGDWDGGAVSSAALQRDVSVRVRGRVVFDVEISADGGALIVADGAFRGGAVPASADLRFAAWRDGAFHLSPENEATFAALNTEALEYAAALSVDERTIAFTRAEGRAPFIRTSIWIARRDAPEAPFGAPVRIAAIAGGVVEGPTFSPDDDAIYYHRKVDDMFSIWRVSR